MQVTMDQLTLGSTYDRPELALIWGYENWQAIGKGIVTPKNDNKVILFITKIKQTALTQYNDELIDGVLYMDGENGHQHDARLVAAETSNDEIYLFYREIHHIPFTYYGRVFLADYKLNNIGPSRFILCTSIYDASAINSLSCEAAANGSNEDNFIPDEEGEKYLAKHYSYERSRKNRAKALEIHGTTCKVCNFNFDYFYGPSHARQYIEVHHVQSITQGVRNIDPRTDLVPVCSNCHAMLHRVRGQIMTVAELRSLIRQT